jgi:S1-C subfamily serine protease
MNVDQDPIASADLSEVMRSFEEPMPQSPPVAPSRSHEKAKRILLPLILGGLSIISGFAGTMWLPRMTGGAAQAWDSGKDSGQPLDPIRISDRFELVAARVSPAVVSIEASKTTVSNGSGSSKGRSTVEDSGSGVLVRLDGYAGIFVLTANHVVAHAPPHQITINLADSRVVRPNQVWTDPESDVAVLRLGDVDRVTTAQLGDSDRMRVGQWVLAIGSPFGLDQTVTHGIISARERGQISLGNTIRIKDFLQTDAALNPGSSGGPLVNLDGEIIGINTAIASTSGNNSGVAFSIPINLVKRVSKQLLEKGSVSRGYLGMQLAQNFEAADALKLGLDRVQGCLVETVYADTPAATAGLKARDVILQVDDVVIRNDTHMINYISSLPVGQKVRLQIWRERRTITLDAEVGDWSKGKSALGGK